MVQNPEKNDADLLVSTGIACLCFIANSHQKHIDPVWLSREIGLAAGTMHDQEIFIAAKKINLKAGKFLLGWDKLLDSNWPAILRLKNGQYIVLIKIGNGVARVFDPAQPRPFRNCDQAVLEDVWNGDVILIQKDRSASSKNDKFLISWFIPEILKYKKIVSEIIGAAILIQIFGIAMPLFSQVIIDKVLLHNNISTLNVLGVGMIILIFFEAILNFLQNYLTSHTATRIDVVLGVRLIDKLFKLPLNFFETRKVGNTVAHVRELENIRQFVTGSSINSILDLLNIIILFPILISYSPSLTLTLISALPVFVLVPLLMIPSLRRRLDEKFLCGAANQSFLVETVTGMHTVKSLSIENIMRRKWEETFSSYVVSSFRVGVLGNATATISQIIQRISSLSILWIGAELVMDSKLSVGQLIAFQMLSGRVVQPIVRISQLWQDFQQAGLSVRRLSDIMDHPDEINIPSSSQLPINGSIQMRDIVFRYKSDQNPVLRNFSIDIKKGMTVGIVGRSGSGKSTLAKLMQKLYSAESGDITIDGIDINRLNTASLREQIGIVLQENFLFDGNIRQNICIQMPHIPMINIIQAARLAGAHDFIMQLPEGYETVVGERGVALSGGQRQRIAIARALLSNPKILIFDEATSALDYESENAIQRNLASICNGRTVIMIAHRLSTIKNSDMIFVMDRGQVVEHGNHSELLKKNGLYYHLFNQQEIENNEDEAA